MIISIKNQMMALLLMMFLLTCCEEMFVMKKDFDIDAVDFPPRLAVTAILDNDSNTLHLTILEGQSVASYYKTQYETISRHRFGTISLFEGDHPEPVYRKTGLIDLSVRDPNELSGCRMTIRDIVPKAGKTYRLEIAVNGYETVTAVATMPDEPDIPDYSLDTTQLIDTKSKIVLIKSMEEGYDGPIPVPGAGRFLDGHYPAVISLNNKEGSNTYYSIQLVYNVFLGEEGIHFPHQFQEYLGIDNMAIMQSNPDIEARDLHLKLEFENIDLYLFDLLMLSFIEPTNKIQLFIPGNTCKPKGWNFREVVLKHQHMFSDLQYMTSGAGVLMDVRYHVELLVQQLTPESFKYYRSIVFQKESPAYFSEPVQVFSNIENGFGIFSIINTKRITLLDFTNKEWVWETILDGKVVE
jgi:hypothetical protein